MTHKSSANNAEKSAVSHSHPKSAVKCFSAHLRLWLVALAAFAVDLWSKEWVMRTIGSPPQTAEELGNWHPIVLVDNFLRLATVENPGAIAGVGAGKTRLLILASVIALGFLFWLFCCSKSANYIQHCALGLLFGGALGNLNDRIFNNGRVIDFIEMDLHFNIDIAGRRIWQASPWPTYNLADVWLCLGVIILLLALWRSGGLHFHHDVKSQKK
ncbi:MAG: signal peptidase II [Sedimentisphaerales bacterium]|nr:signal peptidase II [Sedimentisphaerales bacterium]